LLNNRATVTALAKNLMLQLNRIYCRRCWHNNNRLLKYYSSFFDSATRANLQAGSFGDESAWKTNKTMIRLRNEFFKNQPASSEPAIIIIE